MKRGDDGNVQRRQRTTIVALSAIVVLLAAALIGGWYYVETYVRGPVPSGSPSGGYDATDRRNVVGTADVVFLGEVEALVGEVGLPLTGPDNMSIPMKQYRVRVVQSLKATEDLAETVIINSVEYEPVPSELAMAPGDRYLFAAAVNKTNDTTGSPIGSDWFQVSIQGFDHVRAPNSSEEARLVASFAAAIRDPGSAAGR
jgi:hypothetical protein